MGYRDNLFKFSLNQSLTADAAGQNSLDWELTNPGVDKGSPLGVILSIEAKTAGTTGVNVYICHKATVGATYNDTEICRAFIPIAEIVKGAEFIIALPIGIILLRHMAIYFDLVNSDERFVCSAYLTPMHIGVTLP